MKVSQRNLAEDLSDSLDGSVHPDDCARIAAYLSDRYHIVEKVGYNLQTGGKSVAIDDDDTYPLDESIVTLQLRAQRFLTMAEAARQSVLDTNLSSVDKLANILFSTSSVSVSEARDQAIELIQSGVTIP